MIDQVKLARVRTAIQEASSPRGSSAKLVALVEDAYEEGYVDGASDASKSASTGVRVGSKFTHAKEWRHSASKKALDKLS